MATITDITTVIFYNSPASISLDNYSFTESKS